jgi:uncharacterized protein (DUF486 family)
VVRALAFHAPSARHRDPGELVALFEYTLQVPANRIGYHVASAYQLKILQEAITFVVFGVFAWFWLGEAVQVRYLVSCALVIAAVAIAFV